MLAVIDKNIVKIIIVPALIVTGILVISSIYFNSQRRQIQETAGCRAPNEQRCQECLDVETKNGLCSVKYYSTNPSSDNKGEPWYNATGKSSCDVKLPKCAQCSKRNEDDLKTLIVTNNFKSCNCNVIGGTVDACINSKSCACLCERYKSLSNACSFVK